MSAHFKAKSLLPHLVIIAIFFITSALYWSPSMKGEHLLPGDSYSWLSMSKEARDYYDSTGKNAFWGNNMFSGMPMALTDLHQQHNWYDHIMISLLGFSETGGYNPIVLFFIAMLSMYLLMNVMCINKWTGGVMSVAFAFSSYMPIILFAGHGTKMLDIALLPGIIAGVILAYRGRYFAGAAITGLFLAVFLAAAHYQIIYYSIILIAVLIVVLLIAAVKKKQLKRFVLASLILALTAGLAGLTCATALSVTMKYSKHSIRGGNSELAGTKEKREAYANSWANGVGELFCIMVPNLYGGSSGEKLTEDSHFAQEYSTLAQRSVADENGVVRAPTYWGPQPFLSGPVYFGAVVCFLFILSLFTIRSRIKWVAAAVSLFFMLISCGGHIGFINDIMISIAPMYKSFRTASMALAIPLMLFPMMGAWGVCDLASSAYTPEERWKKLKSAVYVAGGLCVVIIIAALMLLDFRGAKDADTFKQMGAAGDQLLAALRKDRVSLAIKDAFRSLVFVLLCAVALWALVKEKINLTLAAAIIGILSFIDLFSVAKRYFSEETYLDADSYAARFQPRPVDEQIRKDKDLYYRVFDISDQANGAFNNAHPALFHKNVGGYHPAKLEIYQDLIEGQISKYNIPVLNMLNAKYIITPAAQGRPEMAQQLPGALGNAWFVSNINWVKNADDEMKALDGPSLANPADSVKGFDPSSTAVMRESFKSELNGYTFGKDSAAAIRLTHYSPPLLNYESDNSQNGFAVFSDIYYPKGWTATIDGKETKIYRVNYVLRALKIPAGKHQIRFSFVLPGFEQGERLSQIGAIGLTLLIIASAILAFLSFWKNKANEENNLVAQSEPIIPATTHELKEAKQPKK